LSAGRSNALSDPDSLPAAGRTLRPAGNGVVSALPTDDAGAPYDRKAAVYDRVVGARAYNRVVWGTSTAAYREFASEALASGSGPMLDAGCGSALFTAGVYRRASRPLVLVDRSVGMLVRASGRLQGVPAGFVQADLSDLPFAPGCFTTVGGFGTLHVLDDPCSALSALWRQVAPRGQLFASMLVTDRALGGAYLRVLQRAGQVGRQGVSPNSQPLHPKRSWTRSRSIGRARWHDSERGKRRPKGEARRSRSPHSNT
jgi:ubiquinone/menaquinone biosynthesis C-methylase UbiE